MKLLLVVVRWLLALLLAFSFVSIGWGKFSDPGWIDAFRSWGYPGWARNLVGIIEIGAGILMLVPRFTQYAALVIAAIMVGALITHSLFGNHPTFPAAQMATLYLLFSLAVFALARRTDDSPREAVS